MAVIKEIIQNFDLKTTSRVVDIIAVDDCGQPYIDYEGNPFGPTVARSTLSHADIESVTSLPVTVMVVFEEDNPRLPVIVGLLKQGAFVGLMKNTDEKVDEPHHEIERTINQRQILPGQIPQYCDGRIKICTRRSQIEER